ncbi:division/cell wall cluster transcriptional repressor MraZ [Suttonella sp. R2A3]|uniref:division/cell wall cluster transcriptional repressor MraZ n=1 Tax=Suttonella sp. R2A3 TaxID=2908648 RepID=UPI001F1DFE4A|nr:division/cell wall cluster transcriptional repressor MraZ [Suttonella sp. R2A3]
MPTKLRPYFAHESDNTLIITKDLEKNLLVYTLDEWEKVVPQLTRLSSLNELTRRIKRRYLGSAQECTIDASGRVLIPPVLREYAGLDKKTMLVSMGNKFELWDKARWDEVEEEDSIMITNEGFDGLDEALGGLSI